MILDINLGFCVFYQNVQKEQKIYIIYIDVFSTYIHVYMNMSSKIMDPREFKI